MESEVQEVWADEVLSGGEDFNLYGSIVHSCISDDNFCELV